MRLTVPSLDDVEQVRIWRNNEPQFLRTPFLLTEEMQEDFYHSVICNRDSKHRYYSILDDVSNGGDGLFGFGGLTNIEWENGTAEISLIMNPKVRGLSFGREAVHHLINEGFGKLRLHSITGEAYDGCNIGFWEKCIEQFGGFKTIIPHRKYWNGVYYNAMWFCFFEGKK